MVSRFTYKVCMLFRRAEDRHKKAELVPNLG